MIAFVDRGPTGFESRHLQFCKETTANVKQKVNFLQNNFVLILALLYLVAVMGPSPANVRSLLYSLVSETGRILVHVKRSILIK